MSHYKHRADSPHPPEWKCRFIFSLGQTKPSQNQTGRQRQSDWETNKHSMEFKSSFNFSPWSNDNASVIFLLFFRTTPSLRPQENSSAIQAYKMAPRSRQIPFVSQLINKHRDMDTKLANTKMCAKKKGQTTDMASLGFGVCARRFLSVWVILVHFG